MVCLQQLLDVWIWNKNFTRKDLESLLGHLSHAATVIHPGCIFLYQLFSLLSVASRPSFFIRLNAVARADLAWWHCLIHHWNGLSFFPSAQHPLHVYSYASGSFGCGAFCLEPSEWFQLKWPPSWLDIGIAVKELVPVVIAVALWGHQWSEKHVCFHSDNEAVVYAILKRYANHPLLNQLLRCLFFYAAYFKFDYSAAHISGSLNTTADAISRNHMHLFHSFPQVGCTPIPPTVWEFLITAIRDWGSSTWIELFARSLITESHLPLHHPTELGLAAT